LKVPGLTWCDLGSPDRVLKTLAEYRIEVPALVAASISAGVDGHDDTRGHGICQLDSLRLDLGQSGWRSGAVVPALLGAGALAGSGRLSIAVILA